jgi:hypothetical protein
MSASRSSAMPERCGPGMSRSASTRRCATGSVPACSRTSRHARAACGGSTSRSRCLPTSTRSGSSGSAAAT